MSIFNPIARAIWSGGDAEGMAAELKEAKLACEALELYGNPFELITEEGVDAIGPWKYVNADYTPDVNRSGGYFRLKQGVTDMAQLQLLYGEAFDLTTMTQETRRVRKTGKYESMGLPNGCARVIFPEVLPNLINTDGTVKTTSIPNFTNAPPVAVYLPKHTANNANNSNWIAGNSPATVVEHIVIAPKDMDAPLHLHRFVKMTADTIVAIFENLADVRDRETPPTLTLGDTNLAKLTEEQIAIAEEKGWNLA